MIGRYNAEEFAKLMLNNIDHAREEILNWTVRESIKLAKSPAQETCLKRLEWKLKNLLNKCESPFELLECVQGEFNQEIADFLVRTKEVNFNYEELL